MRERGFSYATQFYHQLSRQTVWIFLVVSPARKPNRLLARKIRALPLVRKQNMALMPRFSDNAFAPMVRFIEEYTRNVSADQDQQRLSNPFSALLDSKRAFMQTFRPRFDVTETKDAYELRGELPGVAQEDLVLEFTDAQTLAVRRSTQTSREDGERPKSWLKGPEAQSERETGDRGDEKHDPVALSEDKLFKTISDSAGSNTGNSDTKPKFWVSERSYGSFARFYIFPERVDQDGIKASLKDGVLSISVSKLPARENKKIQIE